MSAERELSTELLARISAGTVKPVLFVYADFPSGAKRLWTGRGNISFQSHTWTGIGDVLGFDAFSESLDSGAQGIQAALSGVDGTLISTLLTDNYQGGAVEIWLAFWDPNETDLETTPRPLWAGTLDTDNIEVSGEEKKVGLSAEHRMVDILRARNFRCTHRDQQYLRCRSGQTDTGFSRVTKLQDVSIPWGRTVA